MTKQRMIALAMVVCGAAGLMMGATARLGTSISATSADGYRRADAPMAAVIGQRATTYWQARTRQDLHACYTFYESSFRSRYEPDAFVRSFQRLNRFGPIFDGIDEIAISPDGARAKVFVKLRATSPLDGAPVVTTTKDVWILADGNWWRRAEPLTPTI